MAKLFPKSVIAEPKRSAFSKPSWDTVINLAKFLTESSPIISEVSFNCSIVFEKPNISALDLAPNVPAISALSKRPCIDIPSSSRPKSLISFPKSCKSLPDLSVVLPTAINCLSNSTTVLAASLKTSKPKKAPPRIPADLARLITERLIPPNNLG